MNVEQIVSLHKALHKLKHLDRRGWVVKKIESPESVADHSLSVAVLALAYNVNNPGLSVEKLLTMAVLHDIGESIIGDISPHDNVTRQDKQDRESAAVKQILCEIDSSGELYETWLDFELKRTPEGVLISQLDKIEAYLQAISYELNTEGLAEFGANTRAALTDPNLISLFDDLEKGSNNTA